MLDSPSDILIVGELPIVYAGGQGRLDIAIFIRRVVLNQVVWTPVMILELKTKTAFNFNFYAEMSRSKRDKVPTSYVWKTDFSEQEWDRTISSIPAYSALEQLDAYENGLMQEYHQLVPDDSSAPSSLWKGVVLLDTGQRYSIIFDAFQRMLHDITGKLPLLESRGSEWTSYRFEFDEEHMEKLPRIALIL